MLFGSAWEKCLILMESITDDKFFSIRPAFLDSGFCISEWKYNGLTLQKNVSRGINVL